MGDSFWTAVSTSLKLSFSIEFTEGVFVSSGISSTPRLGVITNAG